MVAVSEDAEHRYFRTRLPSSAERAWVSFVLDGARSIADSAGEPFVVERAACESALPGWWKDAVVYGILVDRFRPDLDDEGWACDPGPDVAAGGHLNGVTRSLDSLAELGVNVLYLTPVHVAASCHRYDVVDPLRIDPALGGEEAFARLVEACHAKGMRILVDFAMGHAGRGFLPYEDVRLRGRASRFASWFQWTDGEDGPALRHYGKRTDAPRLDLESSPVRALALEAIAAWGRRGIDGIRLDAAAEVPMDLARELRRRLRAERPDAVVLGEVVPEHAWLWRAMGAVDVATDFAFHRIWTELLARRSLDAPAAQAQLVSADLVRGGPSTTAVRFVSTHDHARFGTQAHAFGHAPNADLAGRG